MFQDPALAPDLTVAENLRLTGADIGAVRAELAAMDLDGLDLDEQVRDVPLPFLRMLDLARALAFDPQLLLLDEITAALPPDLSERVFDVMRRWKERNRSVLFISHRLAEVPRALRHVHRAARRSRRGVVRAGRGRRGADRGGDARRGGDASSATRRASAPRRPRRSATARSSKPSSVGAGRQLDDVSLAVAPGEVLGLVALEGQGQETLFDVLAGEPQAPTAASC